MPAKPFFIGARFYASKEQAKNTIARLRNPYQDNEPIHRKEHHDLLVDLLLLHPQVIELVGVGISHFSTAREGLIQKVRVFSVHRMDGTTRSFSHEDCIDKRDKAQRALTVLRKAIMPQILAYKDATLQANPSPICPLTGTQLARHFCHVDHAPPNTFPVLVARWLQTFCLALHRIATQGDTFEDVALQASWCDFHKQNATLRLISPQANLCAVPHPLA